MEQVPRNQSVDPSAPVAAPDRGDAPIAPRTFPGMPRDEAGPVFTAPWQAQAFGLALALYERGCFTWVEWAAALADEIAAARLRGEPDDGDRYYQRWLAALERLASEKGLTSAAELLERKQAWDRAARATPHGKPIVLAASGRERPDAG
jgi:nitrile hydratase accessory protein